MTMDENNNLVLCMNLAEYDVQLIGCRQLQRNRFVNSLHTFRSFTVCRVNTAIQSKHAVCAVTK